MERNNHVVQLLRQHVHPILRVTQDHEETVRWLRENRLLNSTIVCCQLNCQLIQDNTRLDGQEFRCVNPLCRRRICIRFGSLWGNFRRIPLVILVRLAFYYYIEEVSAARAARRLAQAGFNITARSVQRV